MRYSIQEFEGKSELNFHTVIAFQSEHLWESIRWLEDRKCIWDGFHMGHLSFLSADKSKTYTIEL